MMLRLAASTAALMALAQPALAQSAACVEPGDIADATTYAMPLLVDGLQTRCADVLPTDSFILSQGDAFGAAFETRSDAAWPAARRFLMTLANSGSERGIGGMVGALGGLKDEEMRPFVDAFVTQLVATEIKPATCGDVEKVLPLLAPLPPENFGALFAVVMEFAIGEDDDVPICPVPRP